MSISQTAYFAMPVPVQNALVSAYGYYLRRKRQGGSYPAIRERVRAAAAWDAQRIAVYQTDALQRTLELCTRTPYYRERWAAADVAPSSVQGPADLARFPILPKDDVRRDGDRMRIPGARAYWVNHTSGSTGTPVVVHLDRDTYLLVHSLLEAHEEACGIGEDDLRATFAGRMVQPPDRMAPPFWRFNRALRQVLFSAYHMNERTLPLYVDELARRQPAELIGYPSAIATIALHMTQTRKEGTVRPRVVITNSETLFAWQRAAIENAFGCPVRDYYGSAEALIFGPQCQAGAYHFDPLLGVAEVLGEDDRPVNPGESGRLVCTTLTNSVMPLVRYEIGDAATRLEGPCPCGSSREGIREIIGRQDDMIVTPDGRKIGRVDHIFKGIVGIRECQVVQEAPDLVRLLIVADLAFDEEQERRVRHNARSRLGDAVQVHMVRVDHIPRTRRGKFRGVISNLSKDGRPTGINPPDSAIGE